MLYHMLKPLSCCSGSSDERLFTEAFTSSYHESDQSIKLTMIQAAGSLARNSLHTELFAALFTFLVLRLGEGDIAITAEALSQIGLRSSFVVSFITSPQSLTMASPQTVVALL